MRRVKTASRCGFTPQLEGLEALFRARRADGLTVVGFPSGDFRQEPAEDGRSRTSAASATASPSPSWPSRRPPAHAPTRSSARSPPRPGPAGEEPSWNLTKYLLDGRGRLVARFASSVEPDDPAVAAAIDRALATPGL